ncbi:MAG: winged helix-turn-helix transcriptional regulator [Clostridia bacterium]|nr:winged helix-turn-helix transcriptional regulator [Clostridia bacterium]
MRNNNLTELMLKSALYYYDDNITQVEIAKKLGITRQSVGKYLEMAKEQGIVEIKVKNPFSETAGISEKFVSLFQGTRLKKAVIVPGNFPENTVVRKMVAIRADEYFAEIVNEIHAEKIGVSWGKTVKEMVDRLDLSAVDSRADIVPLLGSSDNTVPQFTVNEMALTLSRKVNGNPKHIYLPLDAGTMADFKHYTSTSQYAQISELWKSLDIAFVGIGSFPTDIDSKPVCYPREKEIVKSIISQNPVGDICTNYFDIDGGSVMPESNVLIKASDDVLRNIPRVVGVAGGSRKPRAIIGAIRSGIITDIVTDEMTAQTIIRLISK